MRVLVTGATGFVGSYVLRRLTADPQATVAILVRRGSLTRRIDDVRDRVVRYEADLADPQAVARAAREFKPDAVVHLAWHGVGNKLRNDESQVDNIGHSLALLRAGCEAGAKAFVGLGSQAEYGPCEGPIDEAQPTRPTTLYGAAKLSTCLLADQLCRLYGMRFAWLRLFSAYGPGDSPEWMIPSLILSLAKRRRPALTEGRQLWDYIYVTDAAEAVYQAARNPEASGVFNLGSGEARTVRHVAERIRDLVDPSLALGFGEVPYRPDQVMHLQACIDRLRAATGWQPRVPLDEGLRLTVEWYLEHARDDDG